jgi:Zn-dependent M16 (insulinase) family peptidase
MQHSLLDSSALHPAFELLGQHYIAARQIQVQHFRHKTTGALHYHLSADYDEEVFLVAFRTQPTNSKGVAHILEHSVLCGSEKFPLRDPFFSMMRRSLNSFMNAMTSSDWTAYPFATQNHQDFQNLLEVYLDAVFFPRLDPLDFAQEGIRVELENDQPVFKGIVFNEMKGALSPPARRLMHAMDKHLYQDSTYHHNSGGEPAQIPDLSYDELKAFYQKHYHPSNAVFMSFGQQSAYAIQQQLQDLALHQFAAGSSLSSTAETPLLAPKMIEEAYACSEEVLQDKTYHMLSWLLPPSDDLLLWMGLRLVSGILLENAAAPLRHFLESCPYAKAAGPFWGLNDRNYQLSFSCAIQGSNPEHAAQFAQEVMAILADVAAKPVAIDTVNALLQQIELQQREIRGGMPYGLELCFAGLSRLIHQQDPIPVWDIDALLQQVRQKLHSQPMWLSELIQHYLIDNPHRVQLCFYPDRAAAEQVQQAEHNRLNAIAQALDDEARTALTQQAAQLKQRQASVDDTSLLPKVSLADVKPELKIAQGQIQTLPITGQDYALHQYAAACNGVYYQQVLISLDPAILNCPYLQLYVALFAQVGAGEQDYLQLQQQITAQSGGISLRLSLRCDVADSQKISAFAILSCKGLLRQSQAMSLLEQSFVALRLDEKPRILEILQQVNTSWKSNISNHGHSYAMQNASRQMSALQRHDAAQNGLQGLNQLSQLLDSIRHDEVAYAAFITELQRLHHYLLAAPKQFLLVSDPEQLPGLGSHLAEHWSAAIAQQAPVLGPVASTESAAPEAWLLESNVQFCAAAYPCVSLQHPDAAALMVLGTYLSHGYLHQAIREQGGAYGAGAHYDAESCAFRFYSFRDPRLVETFDAFAASIDWIEQQAPQPQPLEEAILSIIAAMDKPSSPAAEAIAACHASLHGRSPALRQALRAQILQLQAQDLQRVSRQYLRAAQQQKSVLAPFSAQQQLEQMGFVIHQVI